MAAQALTVLVSHSFWIIPILIDMILNCCNWPLYVKLQICGGVVIALGKTERGNWEGLRIVRFAVSCCCCCCCRRCRRCRCRYAQWSREKLHVTIDVKVIIRETNVNEHVETTTYFSVTIDIKNSTTVARCYTVFAKHARRRTLQNFTTALHQKVKAQENNDNARRWICLPRFRFQFCLEQHHITGICGLVKSGQFTIN